MASNNSTVDIQIQPNLFVYAIFLLRIISSSAIFMNLCVLILLVRLKKSFHNYSYWFQIFVLSGEDLFNGLASLVLCFHGFEIFTNYVACSVLLCAYTFAQINTLMAICCICVNRFRSIQNIKKHGESKSGYYQEISIVLVIVYSIVYATMPFLTLNITTTKLPICAAPPIFGSHIRTYKLIVAVGLAVPLVAINIMYGVCLVKLKQVNTNVGPMIQHAKSDLVSCTQITEETYDKFTTKDIPCHTATDIDSCHSNISFRSSEKESIQKVSNPTSVTKSTPAGGNLQVIRSTRDFPTATEECSTSATDSVLKFGQSNPPKYSKARKNTRETQYRAIKLLGIILFMSNIATIIPVAFLFRDVIVAENVSGGGSAIGMAFLALNSLVDAFVYGFYAVEIRTYIQKKLRKLRQLFSCQTV